MAAQIPSSYKIGFLGSGAMAEALIKGLLDKGGLSSKQIIASDKNAVRLAHIGKKYGVETDNNRLVASKTNALVLAVKPQNIQELLEEIKEVVENKLVISIAAGITINFIESYLSQAFVIRVMPNTAALVGQSASALAVSKTVSESQKAIAKALLGCIGLVKELDEEKINSVTAVSGSGPAYFFLLVEALAEAGGKIGLPEEVAYELAAHTLIGSGALLKETGITARTLREKVTSPGGTTEAALKVFKDLDFSSIVLKAVQSAKIRAEELN